jgi:hypothetical protein
MRACTHTVHAHMYTHSQAHISARPHVHRARDRVNERDHTISHLKQYIRNKDAAMDWYALQIPLKFPLHPSYKQTNVKLGIQTEEANQLDEVASVHVYRLTHTYIHQV